MFIIGDFMAGLKILFFFSLNHIVKQQTIAVTYMMDTIKIFQKHKINTFKSKLKNKTYKVNYDFKLISDQYYVAKCKKSELQFIN